MVLETNGRFISRRGHRDGRLLRRWWTGDESATRTRWDRDDHRGEHAHLWHRHACLPPKSLNLPGSYGFSRNRPLSGHVSFRAYLARARLEIYTLSDLLT